MTDISIIVINIIFESHAPVFSKKKKEKKSSYYQS